MAYAVQAKYNLSSYTYIGEKFIQPFIFILFYFRILNSTVNFNQIHELYANVFDLVFCYFLLLWIL